MNHRISDLAAEAWKQVFDELEIEGHIQEENTFSVDEVIQFENEFAKLLITEFAYACMDIHAADAELIAYAAKCYGVEV